MKRKVLSLLAALLIAGTASAQNALTAADITVSQNMEGELTVSYQFDEANLYAGYQFQLVLPEGFSPVLNDKGNVTVAQGEAHDGGNFTVSTNYDEASRTVAVTCFSGEGDLLAGQSGTLLTFGVIVDEGVAVGQTLTARLQGIRLSTSDAVSVPVEESTFNITVGEPDDGRIKFNEASETLPKYTAGDKGNITMTRTIKAGQWSTLVLPFTLTKAKAEAAFGSDVELAEFSGFETEYADDEDVTPDGITINFSTYTMTAKKGLTGGKPFLIRTSKDIDSFEADDVTLTASVTDVEKADEYDTKGVFTGTLVKSVVPADGLFITGNQFWYSTGKTNIKAFRGWFQLGAVLDKETDFGAKLRFTIDGTSTSIDTIEAAERTELTEGVIYNLNGQRMGSVNSAAPASSVFPKGIYIVNGKKVLVK